MIIFLDENDLSFSGKHYFNKTGSIDLDTCFKRTCVNTETIENASIIVFNSKKLNYKAILKNRIDFKWFQNEIDKIINITKN